MSQTSSGAARWILLALGLVALLAMFWASRSTLADLASGLDATLMVAAVLLGLVLTAVQGVMLHRLFAKQGACLSTGKVVTAFLVSQPGKYVPGKIWSVVLQSLALGPGTGHGMAATAIANIELAGITIVQMAGLGLACLLVGQPLLAIPLLLAAAVAGGLIALVPTSRLTAFLPSRLRRSHQVVVVEDSAPRHAAAGMVLMSAMLTGLNLITSMSVLGALGEALPSEHLFPVLATLYLGFAAGMLAVPVPAGLGAREAASVGLGIVLVPAVPVDLVLSVVLLARCWQLAVDAVCFATGMALISLSKSSRTPP